ncbi:MAG: hypothetical protein B6D41_00935 [Chloroflexi bacterium UTCFX4]|jgi:ribokinase|nr:MAG: hypothetical protein B6D41_00935 [Chloroflexi bacterium UTCFX4]
MPIPRIVVVGGLVMDLSFEVPRWPQVREAVQARAFERSPGGKGLNQAVAAARLGAKVQIISAVGSDFFGTELLRKLKEEGVDDQFAIRKSGPETAITCVIVKDGEPGFIGTKDSEDPRSAPDTLSSSDVRKAQSYIRNANAVMATFEVPFDAIQTAFEIARDSEVPTILNPAPPSKLPQELYRLTDFIIPNMWEATQLLEDRQADRETLVTRLKRRGAKNAIITKGDLGCVVALEGEPDVKEIDAFEVEAIDTTGASDAFCSAFAVGLAEGLDTLMAIEKAMAAGALACTKTGALESMPTASQLNNFLRRKQATR